MPACDEGRNRGLGGNCKGEEEVKKESKGKIREVKTESQPRLEGKERISFKR